MLSTDDKRYMYYGNGQLAEVSSWKGDLLHGQVRKWNKMGILLEELNYTDDLLHGRQLRFSAHENSKREEYYVQGIRHGLCRRWLNDNLVLAVVYINGKLVSNIIHDDIAFIEALTPEHHTQLAIMYGI